MGNYINYKCSECGFEYAPENEVFWIDRSYQVNLAPFTKSSSHEMLKSRASGYYRQYYCRSCNKIVEAFHVSENNDHITHEKIRGLINHHSDGLKIIDFDDKFQKCIDCGSYLNVKVSKSFGLDIYDSFKIDDIQLHGFDNNQNYKFWGIYYGYLCRNCKKQINKFIIKQNNGNLDSNELKDILKKHTNDLTVFEKSKENVCPECGEKIRRIKKESQCFNCHKGKFEVSKIIKVD